MANSSPHNRTAPEAVRPVPSTPRPQTPAAAPPPAARTSGPPRGIAPLGLARPWSQRKRQQREDWRQRHRLAHREGGRRAGRSGHRPGARQPRRSHPGQHPPLRSSEGISTPVDLAAVQATYQELAIEYCAPVRNVMIEIGRAEPPVSVLDFVRPAIEWLQGTAQKMDLTELANSLEALQRRPSPPRPGRASPPSRGEVKRSLQRAYAPLVVQLAAGLRHRGGAGAPRAHHPALAAAAGARRRRHGGRSDPGRGPQHLADAGQGPRRGAGRRVRARPRCWPSASWRRSSAERSAAGLSLAAADVVEEKKRLKALVTKLSERARSLRAGQPGLDRGPPRGEAPLPPGAGAHLPARQGLPGAAGRRRSHRPARAAALRQQDPGARDAAAARGGQRRRGIGRASASGPTLRPGSDSLRQRDT